MTPESCDTAMEFSAQLASFSTGQSELLLAVITASMCEWLCESHQFREFSGICELFAFLGNAL